MTSQKSSPEGNESRDTIFIPWNQAKFEKNHFMPENIFFGPKLYPPLHFPGFQVKQKIHMFNFSKHLISKTAAAPPVELFLLKFCQNVTNR